VARILTILVVAAAWPAGHSRAAEPADATTTSALPKLQVLRELVPTHDDSNLMFIDSPSGVVWSSDGGKLAAFTKFGNLVTIWSDDGKVLQELPRPGTTAPVGQVLAFVAGSHELVAPPANGKPEDIAFSVFDVDSGALVRDVVGPHAGESRHVNQATLLVASSDQSILAVGYAGVQPITLLSTNDWTPIAALPDRPKNPVDVATRAAFSSDGKRLAVGAVSGVVLIYDVPSLRVVQRITAFHYPDDPGVIEWLAFNRDASLIAVGNGDFGSRTRLPNGEIRDVFPKELVRVFRTVDGARSVSDAEQLSSRVQGGAWGNSGIIAFVAANTLHLWDPSRSADPGSSMKLERGSVDLAFSPDGTRLAVPNGHYITIFSVAP
jgi:WD40 repeat protein